MPSIPTALPSFKLSSCFRKMSSVISGISNSASLDNLDCIKAWSFSCEGCSSEVILSVIESAICVKNSLKLSTISCGSDIIDHLYLKWLVRIYLSTSSSSTTITKSSSSLSLNPHHCHANRSHNSMMENYL